jgi:hypothetical protein
VLTKKEGDRIHWNPNTYLIGEFRRLARAFLHHFKQLREPHLVYKALMALAPDLKNNATQMTIEASMKANLLSNCDWDVDKCHENLLRLQLQLEEAGGRPLTDQNLRLQFIKNVNIKSMNALLATMKDMQQILQHVKLMQAMDEVPATGSGEVAHACQG